MSDWYEKRGNASDICISTRARLARNVKGMPYGKKLDNEGRKRIISMVDAAIERANLSDVEMIDFSDISENRSYAYFEKHYISSDFLEAPFPKQLVLSKNSGIAIMVNEEDHLRIQSIVPGLDIDTAYNTADKIDDLLSETIEFDFDEKLGYLTKCPTNLGTGLRLSVMMHLPALTLTKQISGLVKVASQLGFAVRGFYGEGSDTKGCIYQISNQETLGLSEKELCAKMESFVSKVIESENKARNGLFSSSRLSIEDAVSRAEGTLRYAKLLSSGEIIKLYSDLKLGASLGIKTGVDPALLDKMLIETAPHVLFKDSASLPDETERDRTRAEYVSALLK